MPTSQERLAKVIATVAHYGQCRRDGATPYLTHVAAVAATVSAKARPVAWLHDVLEDNESFTADLLAGMGVASKTVAAVVAMTKIQGEAYEDYIKRVEKNPLACEVKIADIKHNQSQNPKPDRIRKYRYALAILTKNTKGCGGNFGPMSQTKSDLSSNPRIRLMPQMQHFSTAVPLMRSVLELQVTKADKLANPRSIHLTRPVPAGRSAIQKAGVQPHAHGLTRPIWSAHSLFPRRWIHAAVFPGPGHRGVGECPHLLSARRRLRRNGAMESPSRQLPRGRDRGEPHIAGISCKLAGLKCADDGVLVADGAARCIDDVGTTFHFAQQRVVEQMLRLGSERAMD